MKRLIIAITGASGVVYSIRLLETLAQLEYEVHLTISESGVRTLWEEMQIKVDLNNFQIASLIQRSCDKIIYHHQSDIAAAIASGSFRTEGMVIVPCSMGTLGSIATGISRNLVHRAADVCIKERRKLVLVVRETPLSTIHLENMLKLSQVGAVILPAAPGFYHLPKTLDDQVNFIVTKLLDQFEIDTNLIKRWGES
ncbi:TPA: UbiX family flavin prenyltransferase [Candidatus Poribacteria bacterium]|nr:UbiX family flavin prenyltransferase [Candidatus Poribacteria bacterium]HIA67828.1 UbiX family flavin prenyltransferase [Candidatus Poribacteria bacterium]HIB85866.1 UbiX family flavin prenyltransferase [Candidatus Poribacteria bacterium]HIB98551.1 UbiX family flavin prenyltransferase [Candidatus Poribacteria bacterium]HIC17779.1 UbiX family flavin prenyltransferase [Candidatus Poribacteria bacterium]